MNFISVVLIAIGLSMDAFAVSITSGSTIKKLHIKHALLIGLFFGGFQAIMPVLGWLAGNSLKSFVETFAHWIAFSLLLFIGAKMIYESIFTSDENFSGSILSIHILLLLSFATSIDAFAVGITFAFLNVNVWLPVVIIGLVTFIFSYCGVYIGNKLGHFLENKMELLGGIILIGIGIKIVLEHYNLF